MKNKCRYRQTKIKNKRGHLKSLKSKSEVALKWPKLHMVLDTPSTYATAFTRKHKSKRAKPVPVPAVQNQGVVKIKTQSTKAVPVPAVLMRGQLMRGQSSCVSRGHSSARTRGKFSCSDWKLGVFRLDARVPRLGAQIGLSFNYWQKSNNTNHDLSTIFQLSFNYAQKSNNTNHAL